MMIQKNQKKMKTVKNSKREKENNKKYGVEMKETFPFPEFDSGVPQDDKGNKGDK